MTAILSVLNKKAAAVAADSAVTIDSKKVYMNGEKLFSLANNIPVAVAIYGNLNLISVPWDILIKEYGKYLRNQHPYSTLKEYAANFFSFLQQNNCYLDQTAKQTRLRTDMLIYAKALLTNNIVNYQSLSAAELKTAYDQHMANLLSSRYANPVIMESLNNLNLADFLSKNDAAIDEVINNLRLKYHFAADKNLLSDLLYRAFCSDIAITNHTGLVFIGYGNDEIYPQLYNYEIRDIINGMIAAKEIVNKRVRIGDPDNPTISSFAQNDMFHAIVNGISPEVINSYKDAFKETIQGLVVKINNLIVAGNPKLEQTVQDTITQDQSGGQASDYSPVGGTGV